MLLKTEVLIHETFVVIRVMDQFGNVLAKTIMEGNEGATFLNGLADLIEVNKKREENESNATHTR